MTWEIDYGRDSERRMLAARRRLRGDPRFTQGTQEMRMNLFVKKDWKMHSGGLAHYKIECDALTDDDLECLAWLIAQKAPFSEVHGVPRGGKRLADKLFKYRQPGGIKLIVDDVLTTGASMNDAKRELGWTDAVGVVIFARGACPDWIRPIFEMRWINTPDEF